MVQLRFVGAVATTCPGCSIPARYYLFILSITCLILGSMAGPTGRSATTPVIAVIGGGASGTLTAVHLLRCAAACQLPIRIVLVDRLGRHGQGQAYSTACPAHLLNTPAGQMSALSGRPDHLIEWAGAAEVTSATFLSRSQYGQYLREVLAQAEREAAQLSELTCITSEVLRIRPNSSGRALRLRLADGSIDADAAVLAIGNMPTGLPFPVPADDRVITDPWAPGALDAIADGSPVVVAGTGLTMLDITVAVAATSRDSSVLAVSRHGLLPQPHHGGVPSPRPIWLPVLGRSSAGPTGSAGVGPVRLSDLMWQVRSAIADSPGSWQDIIASLRPYVPGLWHRMPAADQRLFLRHVARYWEVHRHLMPPATASRITELRATRRLSVLRGRISAVTARAGQLRISVDGDAGVTELTAGWLVNGTGATTNIAATSDPLLRDLFAAGLARPDPLRLGIDASTDGAVLNANGHASRTVFTLGPPLRGLWYETTSIPEIRAQAAALATRLAGEFLGRARPGSAA
jgi:uncharacterized NAD(P)/FAD-binding protein YdhS